MLSKARRKGGGFGSIRDGLRCVAGQDVRLGTKANVGSSQYPQGPDRAFPSRRHHDAGTRNYQCWYRNAAAFCTPSTFNLTNGVQVWTP